MLNDVYKEFKSDIKSTLKDFRRALGKIRTGRANPSILEGIKVDYYGSPTPLNQVGTIKVADPRLLTIQPWEKSMIEPIQKAIMASDLGLNPSSDGTIIRLPIPELTGERRKELVRKVKSEAEEHKIVIRNHRREANEQVKEMENESIISEDQMHRGLKKIQQMTDDAIDKIDELVEDKKEEILEMS